MSGDMSKGQRNLGASNSAPNQDLSALTVSNRSEFDQFARAFPSEVFLDSSSGIYLVTKNHFSGDYFSGDYNDPSRKYLSQNCFWGNVADTNAYQMAQSGYGGSSEDYKASFAGGCQIERKGDAMILANENGKQVRLTKVPEERAHAILDKVEFKPLPKEQRPEYLAQLPNGEYLYVSSPKYDYQDEGFKAYLGTAGNMRELKISEVERFRDGGTTFIHTDAGLFFFPTPFNQEAKASLKPAQGDAVEITKLDVRDQTSLAVINSFNVDAAGDKLMVPLA